MERDVDRSPRSRERSLGGVAIVLLCREVLGGGEVSDIEHVSSTLGGDVVFQVTIELDQQPPGLLWGMSADIQIETAE